MKAQKYSSRPYPNGCERSGALLRARHAVQQQAFVGRVDQRMHAFAEHRRTSGDPGRDELGAAIARLPPSAAYTTSFGPVFPDARFTGAATRGCRS